MMPTINRELTAEENKTLEEAWLNLFRRNHTLWDVGSFGRRDLSYLRDSFEVNKKGPVVASTMKGAPFPRYLVKGLADSAIPQAVVRTNDLAGLDGVYSFMRQMHASVTRNVESSYGGKKRKHNLT